MTSKSILIETLDTGFVVSSAGRNIAALTGVGDLTGWLGDYYSKPLALASDTLSQKTIDGIGRGGFDDIIPSDAPKIQLIGSETDEFLDTLERATTNVPEEAVKEDRQDAVALAGERREPTVAAVHTDSQEVLTLNEQRVANAFDKLSLKMGSKQICISNNDLCLVAGVKKGSLHWSCQRLLEKGFLSKIHAPGNGAANVYTLAEGWE